MLHITDMTLSIIETVCPDIDTARLRQLYTLLAVSGADLIEMPVSVYKRILPDAAQKIILRISMPDEAVHYPNITRFVCRQNGALADAAMTREIQMNDIREMTIRGRESLANTRIVGLDDILTHDYESAFLKLRSRAGGQIEFCPENSFYCATAAAVEWVISGGTHVAAAFGGLGGKAALEEVLLALRLIRRYKPSASFAVLAEIAEMLEEITGVPFPDRKAVIGRKIFYVESGIHVDGILKKPQMYEPFHPELVGVSRRFVIGKHSGRKSIAAKLYELGFDAGHFDIAPLLAAVQDTSISRTAILTDEEFSEMAQQYRK